MFNFSDLPDFMRVFLVAFVFIFIGTIALSIVFYFKGFSLLKGIFAPKTLPELGDEQKVLAVAEANGGKVTITEVVLHCQFSTKKSQLILDKFVKGRIAEVWLTPKGDKVYVFSGLIKEEKDKAQKSTTAPESYSNKY